MNCAPLGKKHQDKLTTHISQKNGICNSYIANKLGFVQIIPPSWGLSYQFDWQFDLICGPIKMI